MTAMNGTMINGTMICAAWHQPQYMPSREQESEVKLDLEVIAHESVTIVQCKGRITYRDEATALSAKVAELVLHTRQIVLELSGVETIDSAGLGELLVAQMSGQITGCAVKLACPGKRIRHLLDLTNLSSVFEIHPTLQDALASCRAQAA